MLLTLPCRAWAALTCSTAGRTVLLVAEHVCGTATPAIELRICKLCPMNAICAGTCASPLARLIQTEHGGGGKAAGEWRARSSGEERRRLCCLHPTLQNFCEVVAKSWCGEEVLAPLAPECRKLFSDPVAILRRADKLGAVALFSCNDRHTPNLLTARLWN